MSSVSKSYLQSGSEICFILIYSCNSCVMSIWDNITSSKYVFAIQSRFLFNKVVVNFQELYRGDQNFWHNLSIRQLLLKVRSEWVHQLKSRASLGLSSRQWLRPFLTGWNPSWSVPGVEGWSSRFQYFPVTGRREAHIRSAHYQSNFKLSPIKVSTLRWLKFFRSDR